MAEPVPTSGPRFLKLDDVADELAISAAQTYALVRSGDLPAIKIGGRGQWRVGRTALEQYIADAYRDTERWVRGHPLVTDRKKGDAPIEEMPPKRSPTTSERRACCTSLTATRCPPGRSRPRAWCSSLRVASRGV